ncbi:hypothetical protein AXF42_Ash008538 [Apostasia shenzhenica]|uniref:Uncharacterized protein n=1 Tax=Apostasia shenzhenica TaxID=1088818 RepID=A0A2I0B1N8_9ASPA|nr:hypothetical protein AXF42_Ash008538 [Apostasia shenzhenica]
MFRSALSASPVATTSNRFHTFLGTSVTFSRLAGNFHSTFLFYKTGTRKGGWMLAVDEIST